MHDPNWQQHPDKYGSYPFDRFEAGLESEQHPETNMASSRATRLWRRASSGNVLLVGMLINGRKSKALFLTYYPKDHTLDFAPPDEELYLGP